MRNMTDACTDDCLQVLQHQRHRLPRPPENEIDAASEPQFLAPLKRLKCMFGLLLPSAHLDHLVIELLHTHADPVDPGCLHCSQLLPGKKLRNSFQRDFDVGRNRWEDPSHDLHKPMVIVRLVEVRGTSSKIDADGFFFFKKLLISSPLHLQILQIRIKLMLPSIFFAGKQTVAAPSGIGGKAVGRTDIHVQPLWYGSTRQPSLDHHLFYRHIPLQPEERRGMGMQDPVALSPRPLFLNVVVYLLNSIMMSRLAACVVHSRSEEHTSELQSPLNLVCRLLL